MILATMFGNIQDRQKQGRYWEESTLEIAWLITDLLLLGQYFQVEKATYRNCLLIYTEEVFIPFPIPYSTINKCLDQHPLEKKKEATNPINWSLLLVYLFEKYNNVRFDTQWTGEEFFVAQGCLLWRQLDIQG